MLGQALFVLESSGWRGFLLKVILLRLSVETEQNILNSFRFFEIFGAFFVIPSWYLFSMPSEK